MEEPSQEATVVVPVVEAEAVVEAKGRNFFTSMQEGVSKFGADLRTLSGVGAAASTVAVVQPSLSGVELAEQDIVYRSQAVMRSVDSAAAQLLAREIEYAGSGSGSYSTTLKELQSVKQVIGGVHTSLMKLSRQVGGARATATALLAPPAAAVPVEEVAGAPAAEEEAAAEAAEPAPAPEVEA